MHLFFYLEVEFPIESVCFVPGAISNPNSRTIRVIIITIVTIITIITITIEFGLAAEFVTVTVVTRSEAIIEQLISWS